MTDFKLRDEYITLGQFLKEIGEIGTGGQAKWYLQENDILVNDELDRRRGRKLYQNDKVTLTSGDIYVMVENN